MPLDSKALEAARIRQGNAPTKHLAKHILLDEKVGRELSSDEIAVLSKYAQELRDQVADIEAVIEKYSSRAS